MMHNDDEANVVREINEERLVNLLKDLINIPSPSGEERPLAEYLSNRFVQIGLKNEVQVLGDKSANAIGTLKGKSGNGETEGYTLMLNGHLDTTFVSSKGSLDLKGTSAAGVGIEKGYSPEARVENGRIYGLGAMNMKGALAAYTTAAEAIVNSGAHMSGDLIITCVAGEIVYSPVDSFVDPWMRNFRFGTFYAVTHGAVADMAIVGEPSDRGLYTGHAGIVWVKITTRGKNVNSVYSHELPNPMIRSEKIVNALEQEWIPKYQKRMLEKYPAAKYHETGPGGPVVRIASVYGGSPWRLARTLPVSNIYLDVRTKQPPVELKRELNQFMKELQGELKATDPEFNYEVDLYLSEHGNVQIPQDHILTKTVESAHREAFREAPRFMGQRALDSDAIVLTGYGIPSVNYGPGNPRSFAGVEYVDIDELVKFAKSYAITAIRLCNKIPSS